MMLVSWAAFPLLLVWLCLGCGSLLEALSRRPLPAGLSAPSGFAVIVVLAGLLTARGETAPLATPAVVLAALAGSLLALRRGRRPLDFWLPAAGFATLAVYAAPVVLSGNPTFTGYIRLDDTATWMAFVDRLMEHGRDLSGLAPSSYQATLRVNLPGGYPVGAFLPLGVGSRLTGTDVAWLVQPYMATVAALLASCLYSIARPLVESRPLRALVAAGAAQSALLFGYGLWGGVKEVPVALMIALLAAVVPIAARVEPGLRASLPVAVATVAMLATVGFGGLVWILPILGVVAVALWRRRGPRELLARVWPLVLTVALLGVPALIAAGTFSPVQGGLTDSAELGNLVRPLSIAHYAGIWIGGDFRLDATRPALTNYLIGMTLVAALLGAWLGWRRRAWSLLLYGLGAGAGSIAVFLYSSPWVGAKALASGSPSLLLLALAGVAACTVRNERVVGTTVLCLILGGVLWSNGLGYHDANLAPYDQLRELESIGEEFGGQGPALMTEFQPYGARHFLRKLDGEGASELRARSVPLVGGGEPEKGEWVDTDQIALASLLYYRTLVLRRSPAQSRPPLPYSLVRHGEYYDVWQRPAAVTATPVRHLPLGDFEDPAALPRCAELKALAAAAGPRGSLVAAEREPVIVAPLRTQARPPSWTTTELEGPELIPRGEGVARLRVFIPRAHRYQLYLLGGTRNRLTLLIDGHEVGSVEEQLNESGQFLHLGSVRISAGPHLMTLALDAQSLASGSGGPPEPIGPLVLSPASSEEPPLVEVPVREGRALCGKRLDWIEAFPNKER